MAMSIKTIEKILDEEDTLDLAKVAEAIQELNKQKEKDRNKPIPSWARSLQAWQNKKSRDYKEELRRQMIAKVWPKMP